MAEARKPLTALDCAVFYSGIIECNLHLIVFLWSGIYMSRTYERMDLDMDF